MSIKLYNGLILKNSTLEDALCKLKNIKDECVNSAQISVAKKIAKKVALHCDLKENLSIIDLKDSCNKKSKREYKNSRYYFLETIKKEQLKVEGEKIRSVDWDHTFELCLIPFEKHILAMYYAENENDYIDILKRNGFEDFHYQDSCDKPNDIKEEEWEYRYNSWKSSGVFSRPPCEVGLTYSVVTWDDYYIYKLKDDFILKKAPSDYKRKKSVALKLTNQEFESKINSTRDYFDLLDDIKETAENRIDSIILAPELHFGD